MKGLIIIIVRLFRSHTKMYEYLFFSIVTWCVFFKFFIYTQSWSIYSYSFLKLLPNQEKDLGFYATKNSFCFVQFFLATTDLKTTSGGRSVSVVNSNQKHTRKRLNHMAEKWILFWEQWKIFAVRKKSDKKDLNNQKVLQSYFQENRQ